MEAIEVRDTDSEETRPMRLIDGRPVVWHPLDAGPSGRRDEPALIDATPSTLPDAVCDDTDATRSMRLPLSPEAGGAAAR